MLEKNITLQLKLCQVLERFGSRSDDLLEPIFIYGFYFASVFRQDLQRPFCLL